MLDQRRETQGSTKRIRKGPLGVNQGGLVVLIPQNRLRGCQSFKLERCVRGVELDRLINHQTHRIAGIGMIGGVWGVLGKAAEAVDLKRVKVHRGNEPGRKDVF